jgi:cytochrome c2
MRRRLVLPRPALALAAAALAVVPVRAAPEAPPDSYPKDRVVVGDADRGRTAVERLGCGVCHRIAGVPGAIGIVGPPLDGVTRKPLIAGSLPNRGDVLVRFITNPPSLLPSTGMPAMPATAQEVRDIAAFLATLD